MDPQTMAQMMGGAWGIGMVLMMALAGLLWLLVLALLVAGLVWLVRVVWDRGGESRQLPTRAGAEAPLDILRRRYAAGELSREEFERMKRELAEP